MALKYVDTSAGTNGDGSLGAPWNSLIECMKGTTGYAPVAGDTVVIRGGLTQNVTTAFTMSSVPTEAAPIWWVVDDGSSFGTSWPGGSFTFNVTSGVTITPTQYHNVSGHVHGFNITPASGTCTLKLNTNKWVNCAFNATWANTSSVNYRNTEFLDCSFTVAAAATSFYSNGYNNGSSPMLRFVGCSFDLSSVAINFVFFSISVDGGYGSIEMIGCAASGASAAHSLLNAGCINSAVREIYKIESCNFGVLKMQNVSTSIGTASYAYDKARCILATNINNEYAQFQYNSFARTVSWFYGQNYPVLNTVLPDGSNTQWSIKVVPKLASQTYPVECESISKYYDQTAGTKTITLEILTKADSKATDATLGTAYWWLELTYVDNTTGTPTTITTLDISNQELTDSTALWNTTVWGSNIYYKHKFVVTTPTAIKQYTDIVAVVKTAAAVADPANDCFFVDPDFTVA